MVVMPSGRVFSLNMVTLDMLIQALLPILPHSTPSDSAQYSPNAEPSAPILT